MAIMTILHWLASRVFMVQRTEYRTTDADPNQVSLSPDTSLCVFPQEMIISMSVTAGYYNYTLPHYLYEIFWWYAFDGLLHC